MLGDTLRPPLREWNKSEGPYVIGLVGGSASGKTSVGKRLIALGAGVVDCDKLAHKAYDKGTQCYEQLVKNFGEGVLDESGNINRRILGEKVFGSSEKKSVLENLDGT